MGRPAWQRIGSGGEEQARPGWQRARHRKWVVSASEGRVNLRIDLASACCLAVLLRTPPVAGTASRALRVWRHAQGVGESWMQGGEGWRWSADGRPELSSMDPASDDSLMKTSMGDEDKHGGCGCRRADDELV